MTEFDQKLKKLFERLNTEKSQPSKDWLSATRAKLEQRVKGSQVEHFKPSISGWQRFLFKPATIMAVILIVLLGGGTTFMAQASEPGETLYPLKIAGENFSVLIQVSPEAKARLHMKYADRRLGELEKIYEKDPGNKYWQEKVVQHMSQQMVGAKDTLGTLDDKTQYAEVALKFEEITERHGERLAELEQRLNTSTIIIINHAQALTSDNQQRAMEALEHAHELIEEHNGRHEIMKQRLEARLKLLHARQELLQGRLNQKLQQLNATGFDGLPLEAGLDGEVSTSTNIRVYEEELDGDGLHFESEIEIESEGSEDLETNIDINDGQVIINSRLQATGSTIIIHESSTINASSSQRIRIDGEEVIFE